MRILFLGDIVSKKGREVIRDSLSSLKDKYHPDFVIANAENSAHGKGITYNIYNELIGYGIDAITMGNHTYSKREIFDHLDFMDKLIVPYNHKDKIGEGYRIFNVNGRRLLVANLLGEAFMGDFVNNPFIAYKEIINSSHADIKFVDFHGETTAEKRIFVEYYINDINALVGTHTHIQTADECLLHNRVAFISDVGMCGPYNSIIGRSIDESIRSYVFHEKTKFEVCEEKAILCGVIIDFDDLTNNATNIIRIQIRP